MKRLNQFLLLGILISFIGCTNRTSGPALTTGNQSFDSSQFSSSNSGLFDSGTGTSTTINTSNLFDSSAANSVSSNTTVSSTAPQCVTDSVYVSSNNSLANACYSTNNYLQQNSLLDLGFQSYGNMDYCFNYILKYGQQSCSNIYLTGSTSNTIAQPNWQSMFQNAQVGLINCYRQILAQQMQAANWSSEQDQSYDNNNFMMLMLMSLLVK